MTTIKKYNPYTGKHWEVVVPDPDMKLHPNAVIIIEDGEQKMVSRAWAASMETQGSLIINDPEFTKYDYASVDRH